jgi:hypothetical protein
MNGFRNLIIRILVLGIIGGALMGLDYKLITVSTAHASGSSLDSIISTGIHCHQRLGNRLMTSAKNRKLVGVDSFGAKIIEGKVIGGKRLVLKGLVFGYYCDLLEDQQKNFVLTVETLRDVPNLILRLKTDHSTLFSEYRPRYFNVVLKNAYDFEVEVPVRDFFRSKQAELLESGKGLREMSFSLNFKFPDQKGSLIENWFIFRASVTPQNSDDIGVLTKIYSIGPSGRSIDY